MALHINALELLAATFAVKSFTQNKKNLHIHLLVDNSATVAHITKMGGTKSVRLVNLTKELWEFCFQKQITLTASHIAGIENTSADQQSRVYLDSSNWRLDPHLFQRLNQVLGPLNVDLFADRLNAQLSKFASWKPDPQAMATDAFQLSWAEIQGYAFPPFCMIGRCLKKVEKERCSLIIITPAWHSQPWYPRLLEMSVELPVLLPKTRNLLTSPKGEKHPLTVQGTLSLVAWKISGNRSQRQEFLTTLPSSCPSHGGQVPRWLTTAPGKNGLAGVVNGSLIHFRPLWTI